MFKKKPKVGILSRYTFDNVSMRPYIETGDEKTIRKRLKVIKSNPDEERYKTQQKWILSNMPTAIMKQTNYMIDDVRIIAEISYSHTTPTIQQKPNIIQTGTSFLAIWSIIGAFLVIVVLAAIHLKQEEEPVCTIWSNNNVPYKLVIDTSEYQVNPDGTLPKYTRAFLNPWQQQYIDSGQCERMSRKD